MDKNLREVIKGGHLLLCPSEMSQLATIDSRQQPSSKGLTIQ